MGIINTLQTARHFSLLLVLCSFVYETSCAQKLSEVVVFSKTDGYRHKSIEAGIKSIVKIGIENNFSVTATEDAAALTLKLSMCKVVVFLSTTGDILNHTQQKAFKQFIKNGGGFVGIHAAADTEYKWPWYGKMIGAYFESHPKQQEATIRIIDSKHQSTYFLGSKWTKFDEWYNYKEINPDINILMNLDENSYVGGKNGKNHPIAWFHEFDGGKVFYTGLGHTEESYTDSTFLKHISGGILYAMGRRNQD